VANSRAGLRGPRTQTNLVLGGGQPDVKLAEAGRQAVSEVMNIIRAAAPQAGSYVNETDYHQADWQRSFWGHNYPRLLAIKHTYDPGNLFRVHHSVGSETASD
jgi:FAD/FMN-containing dehydrogenase